VLFFVYLLVESTAESGEAYSEPWWRWFWSSARYSNFWSYVEICVFILYG